MPKVQICSESANLDRIVTVSPGPKVLDAYRPIFDKTAGGLNQLPSAPVDARRHRHSFDRTSRLLRLGRFQGVMSTKEPFERVVAEHGTTVLRVCRVVLGPHDAEDAWSETFVSALRAYPELPETANVEAWLVTIAHRKAIDVVRAAARRPVPAPDVSEDPAGPKAPGGSGGEDTGDQELWRYVRDLPVKQRQVIAYRYLVGLPYAEIASIVGGSAEAARRAAADGIRNLRRSYVAGTENGACS